MRAVAIVGLVLFVSLLVQPAVSQVADDKLIVPGQRIGKWTLDMTITALVEMNGARNTGAGFSPVDSMRAYFNDSREDIWVHWWSHIQFFAATRGRDGQRVEYVFISSSAFKTDKNIAPGATRQAVEGAYGQPTAVVPQVRAGIPGHSRLIYDDIGLAVTIDRSALADSLVVFRPKTAHTLWNF
jgi:hypothetical protein